MKSRPFLVVLPIAMISLVALLALAEDIALILTQFPCPRRLIGKALREGDLKK